MAKTIPQLTDATTVNAADELIIQQGGITKRATATELFNGTGTVTSTGSTTGRRLATRFGDVANVRDFGAVVNGNATTNAAAFQAAINSGKPVYVPAGFYPVDSELLVTTANAVIFGDGARTSQIGATHAGNILVFQPTGAGTVNEYLSGCSLENLTISRIGTFNSAVGATVWVRQCSSFTATNVAANNGNECFRVTGGQLNSFIGCLAFVSNTTIQKTTHSACWVFEEADLGGGNYQPCYTVQVTDFRATTTSILNHVFLIRSVDGLSISNGYIAFAALSLLKIQRQRVGADTAGINISNVYFDCVNSVPRAFEVGGGALGAGQYGAAAVHISNCLFGGNTGNPGDALMSINKYCVGFNVTNCSFRSSSSAWAIQINDATENAPKGSYSFTDSSFTNISQAAGGGAITCTDTSRVNIAGNHFTFVSSSSNAIFFGGTIDAATVVGNTCDNTPTDFVAFGGGITINDNVVLLNAGLPSSGKHVVRLSLPTSDTSLPSGSMWNDGGTVKVKA